SRYLFWFATESFQEPETLARVRSTLGMCPRHTRDLVKLGEASVLTSVLRAVLPAAAARLAEPAGRPGCPACDSAARSADYQLGVIARLLDDQTVVAAYRAAGGLCAAHTVQALPSLPTRHARLLVSILQHAMAAPPQGVSAVEALAGTDPDTTTRDHLRELLPSEPATPTSSSPGRATLERLHRLLEVAACPACLAEGQSERRYLRWLAAGADGGPADGSRGVPGPDELELCAQHLHDLEVAVPSAAQRAAARLTGRWAALLEGCQARLPREERLGSLAGRRSLARAAWTGGRDQRRVWTRRARAAVAAFLGSRSRAREAALAGLQAPWCRVCHAVAEDARSAAGLLLAALGDGPTARRYQASHGLCVRHVLDLWADARAAPARAVLLGRLDVLGWELAEADRKQAWALRYQPTGPEADAWLRAAAIVDGRVFLGGPARSLEPTRPGRLDGDRPLAARPPVDSAERRR
ncbi:MAG TPA: hypothetical protein VE664_01435, partial [Actinomycetes bacterium]|nr:hypothetical protein [Actinomycetes bacterium]